MLYAVRYSSINYYVYVLLTLFNQTLLGRTLRHCKPSKDPSVDGTRFKRRLLKVQFRTVLFLTARGRTEGRLQVDGDVTATAPSRQHERTVGME